MKMLIAGAVLATVVASPASAQSYDPSIGSGNIAPYVNYQNRTVGGALRNYSWANPNHGRIARRANPYAAYGAVPGFGSAAKRGNIHLLVGRNRVVGKDHGPNGW